MQGFILLTSYVITVNKQQNTQSGFHMQLTLLQDLRLWTGGLTEDFTTSRFIWVEQKSPQAENMNTFFSRWHQIAMLLFLCVGEKDSGCSGLRFDLAYNMLSIINGVHPQSDIQSFLKISQTHSFELCHNWLVGHNRHIVDNKHHVCTCRQ